MTPSKRVGKPFFLCQGRGALQNVPPVWEYGEHAGTADVDLALDLVILDRERYENVAERLRHNGFRPDVNDRGNLVRQRWRSEQGGLVDFVMPPVPPDTEGGRQQPLTAELAAMTMAGLELALQHRVPVTLVGHDLEDRNVERTVPVCSPEVFLVLKGLALAGRMKYKDAYDMHYILLHDLKGAGGLGGAVRALCPNETITRALGFLERDYRDVDSRGPRDVCAFLDELENAELAGQALAYMREFLKEAAEFKGDGRIRIDSGFSRLKMAMAVYTTTTCRTWRYSWPLPHSHYSQGSGPDLHPQMEHC